MSYPKTSLVGGLNHFFIFHFIYGTILLIDELHHFSRWLLHHQPDWYIMSYLIFGKQHGDHGSAILSQFMMTMDDNDLPFYPNCHPLSSIEIHGTMGPEATLDAEKFSEYFDNAGSRSFFGSGLTNLSCLSDGDIRDMIYIYTIYTFNN